MKRAMDEMTCGRVASPGDPAAISLTPDNCARKPVEQPNHLFRVNK